MKLQRDNIPIYSIVEEGLMSSEKIAEGRLIPSLVINVNGNIEIEELIKLHDNITAGDVTMTWGQGFFNRNRFVFKMAFSKPMEIEFGIEFKIESDYSLIDGMIESKGVYIQTGEKGDKISTKLDDAKILIEVPDMGIKTKWNDILLALIKKKFRKQGLSKRESINAAKEHIIEMRKFWKMRR